MLSRQLSDDKLYFDADDRKILSLFKKNAEITQDEISNRIKKVQPAVSSRIIKLERQHLLVAQYGLILEDFRVPYSIVRMATRNSGLSLESLAKCDCILNAFTNIGRFNITAIAFGNDPLMIENAIAREFNSPNVVRQVSISPVLSPLKRNIFPLDPSLISNPFLGCSSSLNGVGACFPKIDALDRQILLLLHKNPQLTQGKIAEVIGRSQAAVSNRVINLHKKGLLVLNKGVNFKKTQLLQLIQAEIFTRDAGAIANKLSRCSAVPLGYRVQNSASIIAFFAGPTMEQIIDLIDNCFQHNEHVLGIETYPIIDYARDLILPCAVSVDKILEKRCEGVCMPYVDEFFELDQEVQTCSLEENEESSS